MAANLIPFRPLGVRACATSEKHRRNGLSANFLTTILGWSSEPDYIDTPNNRNDKAGQSAKAEPNSVSDLHSRPSRSRFAPGSFTEEKARQLRMMTTNTASFHDVMYHSAIASRLASDFSSRHDL